MPKIIDDPNDVLLLNWKLDCVNEEMNSWEVIRQGTDSEDLIVVGGISKSAASAIVAELRNAYREAWSACGIAIDKARALVVDDAPFFVEPKPVVSPKTYVVCPTYEQFTSWCIEQQRNSDRHDPTLFWIGNRNHVAGRAIHPWDAVYFYRPFAPEAQRMMEREIDRAQERGREAMAMTLLAPVTDTPTPAGRTYVVAGDVQQFRAWCMSNGRSPHDPSVFYVRDLMALRGRHIDEAAGDTVVWYGTWYQRNDADEIENEISRALARTS